MFGAINRLIFDDGFIHVMYIQDNPTCSKATNHDFESDLCMIHSPLFFLFVRQGYSVPCVPELDDLTVGGLLDFALCPDESNSSSRSHSREKRHDIS